VGLATKIRFWSKTCMIQKSTRGTVPNKLMKEFPLKSWSKRVLSCSVVSSRDKSVVRMNWNGSSLMSGAVLNSRFLTRLLTSGEEDFERVSVLNEELVNCMAMLILSISVTFSVHCLTATCLITKSCQQRWPIHSCSFYKVTVVQQQIWGLVVYFRVHLVGFNFCLQVKKILKSDSICQSYAQMKNGRVFYDSQC